MWVLFDLDGTLTQSEEGIWNCARYALGKMGFPEPDAATLRKFIGPPLMWSFRNLVGMTEEQALQAQTVYRERYNTVGLFENRVYPGIRYALRCLKKAGIHMGVVTGKPEKPTKRILEHFGLAPYFESVLCATDNKADKEQMIRDSLPEGFGEAWMVGDRKFDMEGGRLAGIHTLGVTYGYGSEEELLESGAEKLARTPREIAAVLCPEVTGIRGAFLSMEGPDGSGKGTQLERLQDTLDRYGFEVIQTREPGGTLIGEKIRGILLDPENAGMTDETEALLYASARAQLVREVIRPAVEEGKLILCDRFVDSSAAYQGGGRQMGIERVLRINEPAVDGTLPDLTVYLDIDHRTAMARRCAVSEPDRMELEAESFHARVEDGYHRLIAMDPDRFAVVNAEGDRDSIAAAVAEKVLDRLLEMEH
jgi:dTMP kinase